MTPTYGTIVHALLMVRRRRSAKTIFASYPMKSRMQAAVKHHIRLRARDMEPGEVSLAAQSSLDSKQQTVCAGRKRAPVSIAPSQMISECNSTLELRCRTHQ
jgi:hypothetical protein